MRLIFDGNFENQEVRYDEENQDEFSRAGYGASSKQHQPLHKWPQILSPAVNTASPHFPQTACRLLQIDPFRSESRKDNGVPPVLGIKLEQTRIASEGPVFPLAMHSGQSTGTKTAAGGIAPPGKDLMQIYFTHTGLLGKRRFGYPPLLEKPVQQFANAVPIEAVLIFR